MQDKIKSIIEQTSNKSSAGEMTFGAVVSTLMEAGVVSYFADYRSGSTTYYLQDGQHLRVEWNHAGHNIPLQFDFAALKAAILGAQKDEVRYPQFVTLSIAAGCVGYIVWISGRHVSYFGHSGEVHVEKFPSAAQ